MDKISRLQRSRNMSRIKSKNTRPELLVRQALHSIGIRYRIHNKDLPGKPDISIKKYKLAVEIRGCFWHRHENCRLSSYPKTNKSYWINKIEGNQKRDLKNKIKLEKSGYKVFVIWECQTKSITLLNEKIEILKNYILTKKQ